MSLASEIKNFEKSLRLHSSRYNMFSQETLIRGNIAIHNRAVNAINKLENKVVAEPSKYSDLLLELLQDDDLKLSMWAGFICLKANIYTDKALEKLEFIAKNTSGLSLICAFDLSGSITHFKKRQLESKPHNEIDEIAEMMNKSDIPDGEILNMVLNLQDIDMCGHDERTALFHACAFKRNDVAKKLIELGADINKSDSSYKTALHSASITGNIEIIPLLLDSNADINAQEKRGFTALDFAKANMSGLPQSQLDIMINLLILHGAKTKQELLNANS